MSKKTNDGEPAFPVCYQHENLETGEKEVTAAFHGMSLRDWFAGQALVALVHDKGYANRHWPGNIAGDAYKVADSMLAAREKWTE